LENVPGKCRGKLEFSAEKSFDRKFSPEIPGKFYVGKNVRKIDLRYVSSIPTRVTRLVYEKAPKM
jgi:hypothetical protein